MFRKFAAGVAAATLAVSTVAAQAAPAPRAGSPVAEEEGLAGGLLLPLLAVLAAGLVIFLVVDDSDEPVSP